MQNLQSYQVEEATYELDTHYNIGYKSRFRLVGIIEVNESMFFICEREAGAFTMHISADKSFQTKNFIFHALQFHHLAQIALASPE